MESEAKPMHQAEATLVKIPASAGLKRRLANLRDAPRCQARTRSVVPCQAAAVKGKRVCRMHGGAKGTGAPKGEANGAYVNGAHTQEAVALRREAATLLRDVRRRLADV